MGPGALPPRRAPVMRDLADDDGQRRAALEQLARSAPDAPTRRASVRLVGLTPGGLDPATGDMRPPTPPTRDRRGYVTAAEVAEARGVLTEAEAVARERARQAQLREAARLAHARAGRLTPLGTVGRTVW